MNSLILEPVLFTKKSNTVPDADSALPGRENSILPDTNHTIYNHLLNAPCPDGFGEVWVGLGCFWGAERKFWQTPGVWLTAAGYAGGHTPNATYGEVCSGKTGHTEAVRVIFDPEKISFQEIMKVFWESHDPTQGMRQGNDVGTQYRSAIYYTSETQGALARHSKADFQSALADAGHSGTITTEIAPAQSFYYAEAEHQQYLDKHPGGYCGLGGTGVSCPMGTGVTG